MGRNAASLCLLSALVMALAACASDDKKAVVEANIFPTAYKEEIIDTMIKGVFEDATNVRDAYITDPVLRPAGKEERYTVCVRSNSRNVTRKYMGIRDHIGYFYGGHLNQLIDATKEQCGNAAYKPFPELEKLCHARACL